MKFSTCFALASVLFSASLMSQTYTSKVIYGDDNRVDVYASSNSAFVELSKSTAAMIPSENLKSSFWEVVIQGTPLIKRGICSTERFSNQMAAASCSGFLVGEDTLVTAGHCIRTEADCQKNKWVFDYKLSSENQKQISVPKSSVYSCKKIIATTMDNLTGNDFAVIKLSKKVHDRRPLSFRRTGKVAVGDPLVVIGHPTGMPAKISDGANVRSLMDKFFVANLDTFGGNSGSAVFNVATSEVEGILVRGERDYIYHPDLGCQVANLCQNDACRGEDVTYITNIPDLQNLP